jgi:glycosyltransferase involved in cell wall biosynthesis
MVPAEFYEPFIAHMEQGVRSATVTIVSSEYTRQAVITGWDIDPERVIVVHYGVDPERFARRPGGRRLVAEKLGEDRPYVLFVGVPSHAKGVPQLRAAVARLARDGYPHALVIAGPLATLQPDEWREEASSELAGARGRLCWFEDAGDEQLVPLYSEADVVCLPSVKESFGLPMVEAMACRAPVLAGNRAALPEVVGDAGLLCEPTVEGVTEGLRRIIDDSALAQTLADKGRARAEQMTWRHTAEGWMGALQRAATLRD